MPARLDGRTVPSACPDPKPKQRARKLCKRTQIAGAFKVSTEVGAHQVPFWHHGWPSQCSRRVLVFIAGGNRSTAQLRRSLRSIRPSSADSSHATIKHRLSGSLKRGEGKPDFCAIHP